MDDTDERLLAELMDSADAMFDAGDFIAAERAYKSVLSMVRSCTPEDGLEQRYCLSRIADCAMQIDKFSDAARSYNQLLVLQLRVSPFTPDTIGVLFKLINAMRLSIGVSFKMILASAGAVLLIGTAVIGASMWIPGATQNTTPKAASQAKSTASASAKTAKSATTNKKAKKKKKRQRAS